MVLDMVTGEPWTPDTKFVTSMYNLGRYVDDTKGELVQETTTQGEREAEFRRWAADGERAKRFMAIFLSASHSVESTDDYDEFAEQVLLHLEQWEVGNG